MNGILYLVVILIVKINVMNGKIEINCIVALMKGIGIGKLPLLCRNSKDNTTNRYSLLLIVFPVARNSSIFFNSFFTPSILLMQHVLTQLNHSARKICQFTMDLFLHLLLLRC